MAGGRPTDYSEEMLELTNEYILNCEDEIKDGRLKVNLPSVEGLSLYLGVARSTVYKWADEHAEFSDTLDVLKAKQQERLVSQGLSNNYNATITKLMLSSNHGMREKSDVTSDDKGLNSEPMIVKIIRNGDSDSNRDTGGV